MGFAHHVTSVCTPASAPLLIRRVASHKHKGGNFGDFPRQSSRWRRSSCGCCDGKDPTGTLQHHHHYHQHHDVAVRRQWQGKLHNGAILALLLRHTVERNAGRLSLVSTSTDAQLLLTSFGVPPATAAESDSEAVVERCALLRGSESGGPIFSLGVAPHLDLLFTGHAERELRLRRLKNWSPVPEVALGGHTGWVRALAVGQELMISAACNFIKVWKLPNTSDASVTNSITIKHLGDLQLFKGDVLVVAMDNACIYAATADGMLHMWTISQVLENTSINSLHKRANVQAHKSRIISLVLHNNDIITAGHDGHIRVWCKLTLQMKAEATSAHNGAKLHALATASTFLFSGGADEFVRIWDAETLAPVIDPVQAHAAGVRSLSVATTSSNLVQKTSTEEEGSQLHGASSPIWVVSGDAQGEVILWSFGMR